MERLEIPGDVAGATLVLAPTDDGLHRSVVLQPEWLRPLAAWLAGSAQPGIVGHDEYGMPYGRWLAIAGDETAVAYATHSRAELTCRLPFGCARVAVGSRRRPARFSVLLNPETRAQAAAYLRRADATRWTAQPL